MSTNEGKNPKNKGIKPLICPYCDNVADEGDLKCRICQAIIAAVNTTAKNHSTSNNDDTGAPPRKHPEGSSNEIWSCPSCTYHNQAKKKFCEVCFTFRKVEKVKDVVDKIEEVDISEIRKESWKCCGCSQDNFYDTYLCASCHKYAPFFQKWRCERCSFFNDDLEPRCKVCEYENKHLKVCEKCRKNDVNEDFGDVCVLCEYVVIGNLEMRPPRGGSVSLDTSDISFHTSMENEWDVVELKSCSICKKMFVESNEPFCSDCNARKWNCNNHWCGAVNFNGALCYKCKLKKGSNVTEYNTVEVFDGHQYVMMWQCTLCGRFCNKDNCHGCNNMRLRPGFIKCSCKWSNSPTDLTCGRCCKLLQ